MDARNRLVAVAAAVAMALAAAPRGALALSYVMMDDAALYEQSEGVARFVVDGIEPVADGDVETRYRLRPLTILSGKAIGTTQVLALPGTFDAPFINHVVYGVPKLSVGQTILVFYQRRVDGALVPQQLTLGLFGETSGAGGKVYVRYLDDAGDASSGKNAQFAAVRDAEGFDQWIRARALGLRPVQKYLLDAQQPQSKYTLSTFNFPQPGPGRWFQFDSGQSLPWTAAPGGQANTARDEFAALQQALAAWTNDPGSRITMHYAGTASSAPSSQFSGHVLWNDPNNQIAGSFSCSSGGVLGVGGSSAFSNGQTLGGRIWYPRASAYVTIQDGAGCHMDGNAGANGAELLTHEIGHTIGFGHSCGDSSTPACSSSSVLNDATMRASMHGDGRGAALRADDRAAAAVAYPAPGGGSLPALIHRNGFE